MSGAVSLKVRAELRDRARAAVGLALVIGLAGGLVIAAAAGARRTSSAFEAFRKAQNTAQSGIANPAQAFGFATVDFDKADRLPSVAESARFSFFVGFVTTSRGTVLTMIGDRNPVVMFASADDRFDRTLNKMLVTEGRLSNPDAVDEVVASYIAATSYGLRVGDTLDVRFPAFQDFEAGPSAQRLTGPRIRLRVVGIEATSSELPPGLGYPPLHLTSAFFKRYVTQTPTFPADMVRLRADSDIDGFEAALQDAVVRTPGRDTSSRIQFFNEVSNARAIERTIHIQSVALWLLAALAGLATVLILGQALVREAFLGSQDHPALR
ncbi:MAG: hypothetical protein E6G68_10650, partial [Actinobacteria bacterium]